MMVCTELSVKSLLVCIDLEVQYSDGGVGGRKPITFIMIKTYHNCFLWGFFVYLDYAEETNSNLTITFFEIPENLFQHMLYTC